MSTVALLGASGLVGRLIADQLRTRGFDVLALGREAMATAGALGTALSGSDVLISAIGGAPGLAERLISAAVETGVHLVDIAPEQGHVQQLHQLADHIAADGGPVRVVAGAGLQHVVGDTLAHLAGLASGVPDELHVAYTFPDRKALLAAASPGRRRSAVEDLVGPTFAYVHGTLVEEPVAEQRRLAWFPRPVGPSHAASVPAAEALSVPRHLPDVATVRTYMALSGGRSELLQLIGNLARSERLRELVIGRMTRPNAGLSSDAAPERRAAIRWGAIAEASGTLGIARAWAYGHDPYRLTAAASVVCAEAVVTDAPGGLVTPAELLAPGDLLDLLAARTDLRWSLIRPESDLG